MNRIARALLALLTLLAALVPPVIGHVAPTAAAAETAIPGDPSVPVASGELLPFSGESPGDILVDETNGHVFVSGGQGTSGIAVAGLDGELVQEIPDLAGAEGLLLSRDGTTLYVALRDGEAVAAVDTSTMEVTTYPTGADTCPRHLAEVGDDIYFTTSCGDAYFGVMRLDTATRDVASVSLTGEPDDVFEDAGPIVSDPAYPNRFFVADNHNFDHLVHAYDVDGLTATRSATQSSFDSQIYSLDLSPDGDALVVGHHNGMTSLNPADLSEHVTFGDSGGGLAVSVAGDHVASSQYVGESRVFVHDRAGSWVRTYFFDSGVYLPHDSVEWSSNRLYAVALDNADDTRRLYTLTDFATPGPLFDVRGPGSSKVHSPVHFDGAVSLGGQPFAARDLAIWRSGPDGLVGLEPVVTGADGSFAVNDTPPRWGSYRYIMLYNGEPAVAPERVTMNHTVRGVDTMLSFVESPEFSPGDAVVLHGALTLRDAQGTPVSGATISLTQTHRGQTTTLPSVVTGPDGKFSVEVADPELGGYLVEASYAGDTTNLPSEDYEYAVVRQEVTVELTAPSSYLMRSQPAMFRGRLTTDAGEPVGGRRVYWQRYAPWTDAVAEEASVMTEADGSFTFTDDAPSTGPNRWLVWHPGDETHGDADIEISMPVFAEPTDLRIASDRPGYAQDTQATVTAWVSEDAVGNVTLSEEPYGEPRTHLATGQAGDGADVVGTLWPDRNTKIIAEFHPGGGSDAGYRFAPRQVSMILPFHPTLQQGLRRFYAMEGRTYLVHRDVDPLLRVQVLPNQRGRCVYVRVERFRDGRYRFVRSTDCIRVEKFSVARWTLTGNPRAGARFRLRYRLPGNAEYARTTANWTYVRFTR